MVEITQKEFQKLADYIKSNFGVYLKQEKQTLLTARLSNILDQNQFGSFSEYYDHVISDITGDAVSVLIDKITTNYTYFLRESQHFNYLKEVVLPHWEKHIPDKDLRIWSAGCSSGEEAYTVAIILSEYFKGKFGWDKKILATDISSRVLKTAKEGIYSDESLEKIPAMWKMSYFDSLGDGRSQVCEEIRNEVIFRRMNLMTPHFIFKKKFHLIFCRNVMIYFDNATRAELVKKFYDLTEPGGYLFVGHTESLQGINTGYRYVKPAIYRKTESV